MVFAPGAAVPRVKALVLAALLWARGPAAAAAQSCGLAEGLADRVSQHPQFEIVTSPVLSLFTFRLAGRDDAAQIAFVNRINDDGRIYITQTEVDGQIAVRFQIGQFDVTQEDVHFAYDVLCELAA